MDYSIRLHKNHQPVHKNRVIETQKEYDNYMAMLNYIINQVELGFSPMFLVSLHYNNPSDYYKTTKETNNPLGHKDRYGPKTKLPLSLTSSWDKFIEKNRRDIDATTKNARKVLNLILKILYGVKRLNRPDKFKFPNILVFHELGKYRLQYHTHILLPQCGLTANEIEDIFNTSIKKRCKCLSITKRIDVKDVKYDSKGILAYLNKETNADYSALDPINSIPIIPTTLR